MRSTARFFLLFAASFILTACNGLTVNKNASARIYNLPGVAVYPEGVAYNPDTGKAYISATGDGTLYQLDVAGGSIGVFSPGGAAGRTMANGMKVDEQGRLWVAGGATARMYVYDTADGELLARYATPDPGPGFVNDVALGPDGAAYFTDSFRPFLFRISGTEGGQVEPWLDFRGTALEYEQGFNLNGIALTPDERYLIVVHSSRGELYRIDIDSREVAKIDLGGETVTGGDGILFVDGALYVVRNRAGVIVPVELSADYSRGTVAADRGITHESFIFPTTIARVDDSLLVVNAQIDRRETGPDLPFTVARIPLP